VGLRIVLAAEESAGIQVLRRLLVGDSELVAVLSASRGAGRGATVATVAERAGVDILPAARVKDPELAEWIHAQRIDLLLNVHSLFLIHPAVAAAPRIGSFNLHPGPLPHYAGLDTPSWAIYNGEREYGVTVHWMDAGIDTGAVAYEARFAVEDDETGLSLSAKCVRFGVPLVDHLIADADRDPRSIPVLLQDSARRRYFKRQPPQDGWLAWDKSVRDVDAFVRAADFTPFESPWGHPRAALNRMQFGVVKVAATGERSTEAPGTVARAEEDSVRVACADEWILVRRIQTESGIRSPGALLPHGARLALRRPPG
jgi:methionyl-tRNA formyltransferase